jgi:hypothetical protein
MNVRTITSFVLAIALMAPVAGTFAAEQRSKAFPYTGPDKPLMTTASIENVARVDRDTVHVPRDSTKPRWST